MAGRIGKTLHRPERRSSHASKRSRRRRWLPERRMPLRITIAWETTLPTSMSRTITAHTGRKSSTDCRAISMPARSAPILATRICSTLEPRTVFGFRSTTELIGRISESICPPSRCAISGSNQNFNDLVIATHGRDVWILDDLDSVQQLGNALRAGAMLFAPRMAYEYHYHSNDPGIYTQFAGDNPPKGAIVDFYQTVPQKKAPSLQILDAGGAVIRTVSGTHKVKGKEEPSVPNKAGINYRMFGISRRTRRRSGMGPRVRSTKGPRRARPSCRNVYGALGDGRATLTQRVTVKPDPRDQWTQAQYESGYAFARKYSTIYGKIDEVLNNLDAIKKSLTRVAASAKNDAAIASQVTRRAAELGPGIRRVHRRLQERRGFDPACGLFRANRFRAPVLAVRSFLLRQSSSIMRGASIRHTPRRSRSTTTTSDCFRRSRLP